MDSQMLKTSLFPTPRRPELIITEWTHQHLHHPDPLWASPEWSKHRLPAGLLECGALSLSVYGREHPPLSVWQSQRKGSMGAGHRQPD